MIEVKVKQGSEAWFEERMGRFTASKFSTLMSKESTKGYQDLITQTAGEILSSEIEETYSNDIMQRGIELEPLAAEYYQSIFDVELHESGLCIPDENDKLHEYVGVSPDRFIGINGILEIKCPLMKTHINYIEKGVLPNEYKWQVQGQLLITEREYCDFMSFYPKLKPFIIRIYPDEKMQTELINRFELSIKLLKQKINTYEKYDYEV